MGLEYVGRRRIRLEGILSDVLIEAPNSTILVDTQLDFLPTSPVTRENVASLTRVRNGNGHKKEKVRDLYDSEKAKIQAWFELLNGCIAPDACVEFKKNLDDDVKIFQITGYVTALHGTVKRGLIVLRNMEVYETYLRGHRNLWTSYNSPKYVALRERLSLSN